MILLVSLNLAIERIVRVPRVAPGGVMRGPLVARHASAKGVNAARALAALGEPRVILGAVGGLPGELIERELEAEGIPLAPVRIGGESRTCMVLLEAGRADQTVINEVGPELTEGEVAETVSMYQELLERAQMVLVMGSLPAGAPPDLYARFIEDARAAGRPVLLDASGDPLACGVRARPDGVKINAAEASAWFGRPLTDAREAMDAADRLVDAGVGAAMVTLGARGAVLSSRESRLFYRAPGIEAVNCVGSGDAALAGLAVGLLRGEPLDQAGALSVATGTASALHGAGRCTAEEIASMLPRVRCQPF